VLCSAESFLPISTQRAGSIGGTPPIGPAWRGSESARRRSQQLGISYPGFMALFPEAMIPLDGGFVAYLADKG
jgi:hypothetical protein